MKKSADRLHAGHLLGMLLVSASSLLLEVCLTRLLAVTLWYHFAFMIISGGLLGFGAASVVVSLWRRLAEAPLDRALPAIAAALALAVVLCFWLSQALPLRPFELADDPAQTLYLAATYLLLTVPFFLAGLAVSLLLSRLVRSVTLLYALDLGGAGAGAVLALGLMSWVGGLSTLVVAAALAAGAAVAFAWPLGWRARGAGLGFVAILLVLSASADRWLTLRVPESKVLGRVVSELARAPGGGEVITRWSPVGRVDVVPGPRGERRILIDGGVAATRVPRVEGSVEQWRPPPEGMAAALSLAPDAPTVIVIGSGGGYEVASALALGAARVEAVEMNGAIVDLVRTELDHVTGGLFHDPRVELIADEGRSFVRRGPPDEQADVIGCVHTISNAAWASGALSLGENYTLTVEAIDDFLARLSPGGVLWLTRPEAQVPRLVATVRAALERRDARTPSDHIVAYRQPVRGSGARSFLGGVIVAKRALTGDEVAHAAELLARDRLEPLLLPGQEPRGWDAGALRAALGPWGPAGPAMDPVLGELRPTTDERPYFNQRRPWSDLGVDDVRDVMRRTQRERMALEEAPVAEVAVLVVIAWASLFSAVLVAAPLLLWWRTNKKVKKKKKRSGLEALRFAPYFVALGLGYITVEVCLIQRLGLFVGRPEYALAVVLCALLVSSGAGSLASTRWAERPRRASLVALGAVVALVAVHALLGPAVTGALLGLSLASRMAVAALLVAPLGFAMGMPMPLGLRAAPAGSPHLLAWLFGLNCAASVIGSSACVILSSSLGFGGTLLAAASIYAAAALATLAWRRVPQAS